MQFYSATTTSHAQRLAGLSLYPHGKEQELLLRSRIDEEEQPLRLFSTLHMTNNPLQGDVTRQKLSLLSYNFCLKIGIIFSRHMFLVQLKLSTKTKFQVQCYVLDTFSIKKLQFFTFSHLST